MKTNNFFASVEHFLRQQLTLFFNQKINRAIFGEAWVSIGDIKILSANNNVNVAEIYLNINPLYGKKIVANLNAQIIQQKLQNYLRKSSFLQKIPQVIFLEQAGLFSEIAAKNEQSPSVTAPANEPPVLSIASQLRNGFAEIKKIRQGELSPTSFADFMNEL
jgi:hypothetical protein